MYIKLYKEEYLNSIN